MLDLGHVPPGLYVTLPNPINSHMRKHCTPLKVGFRMRASTHLAFRARGQLSNLTWAPKSFRLGFRSRLGKKPHRLQRLLHTFFGITQTSALGN